MSKKRISTVVKCGDCGCYYSERTEEAAAAIIEGKKKGLCSECYISWAKTHYAALEEQLFDGVKFPVLKGSEKQIKWADRLRKHYVLDRLAIGVSIDNINFLLPYATQAATWIKNRALNTQDMTKVLLTVARELTISDIEDNLM